MSLHYCIYFILVGKHRIVYNEDPGPRTQDPGSRIWDPESGSTTQDIEPETPRLIPIT